jgi:Rrf2 family protein
VKISQKGFYALQALSMLARHPQELCKIHDIASEGSLPEKFLELILIELKNARFVEAVRGANGGYRLRKPAASIRLGEIVRLIDGSLCPFCDADRVRGLIEQDPRNRALYQVFLDVRDATARILDNTTLADLVLEADKTYTPPEPMTSDKLSQPQ